MNKPEQKIYYDWQSAKDWVKYQYPQLSTHLIDEFSHWIGMDRESTQDTIFTLSTEMKERMPTKFHDVLHAFMQQFSDTPDDEYNEVDFKYWW